MNLHTPLGVRVLILPYITYGILARGNCGIGQINQIIFFQFQKKALRIK